MIRYSRFVHIVLGAACAATAVMIGTGFAHHAIQGESLAAEARERFQESALLSAATVARMAEHYLVQPERHPLELIALARSLQGMEGFRGVTISGFGSAPGREIDTVWASSEATFLTNTGALRYQPGRTRVQDELSGRIPELVVELNREADSAMQDLTPQIEAVTQSILDLLIRTPAAEQAELAEADEVFRVLYQRGSDRLATVTRSWAGMIPAQFDAADPPDEVLIFHPVATMDRNGESWYTGIIRVRRSTAPLRSDVEQRVARMRREITRVTVWGIAGVWIIALAAALWVHLRTKEIA